MAMLGGETPVVRRSTLGRSRLGRFLNSSSAGAPCDQVGIDSLAQAATEEVSED